MNPGLLCYVFADHPQSLLTTLEKLQNCELPEEHARQLAWILKVARSHYYH